MANAQRSIALMASPTIVQRMSHKNRLWIICISLLSCVGCHQSTKFTAKYFLEGHETISMFGDVLRLSYTENVGGFLSLSSVLPDHIKTLVFLVFSSLLLVGLVLYTLFNHTMTSSMVWSAAVVTCGGVGNLIDRFVNGGAVIDFLNVGIGAVRTGRFNVADMAIMGGATMLVILNMQSKAEISLSGNDHS